MKKKDQVIYLKRWVGVMLRELAQFKQTSDPEALHQCRVAKKRLQAWITFTEDQGNNKIRCVRWQPLKKIYRDIGKIRSLQLLQQYIKDHLPTENQPELPLLTEMIKTLNRDYNQHRKVLWFYQQVMPTLTASVPAEVVSRYISDQFSKIAELLQTSQEAQQLHRARIEIKRLIYLHEIPGTKWPKHPFFTDKKLEKLQQELGEWHDRVNYVIQLKKEFPDYQEAINFAEKDEQKLFEQVIISLKKLFQTEEKSPHDSTKRKPQKTRRKEQRRPRNSKKKEPKSNS